MEHLEKAGDWLKEAALTPLAQEGAEALVVLLSDDVFDASVALQQSIDRVEHGRMAKARERVLGVADRVAAIIVKGGREAVMGYKPQLARSGSGLVTALIVESLLFVPKHGYRFGRLGRTGLEAVRRELTEKVLAYNLDRIILLRKRKQKAHAPPKAA